MVILKGGLLIIVVICATTSDTRAVIKSTPSITLCVSYRQSHSSMPSVYIATYSVIRPAADDTVVPQGTLLSPDRQGYRPEISGYDASQHVGVAGECVSMVQ